MKKFPIIILALIVMALLSLSACQTTVAPGGAYNGDNTLYNADRVIVGAYDVLHTFVKWEFKHRDQLSRWPEIRKAADVVRRNASRWIESASALREAYASAPTSANRNNLATALTTLSAAITEATSYMAKPLN